LLHALLLQASQPTTLFKDVISNSDGMPATHAAADQKGQELSIGE
jgi:hypothetical protein